MADSGLEPLRPGTLVASRYRLERLLGQGGMGAVWSARHEVTRKRVALKFLTDSAGSPENRQRFAREGRAATALCHPNVVEVFDVLEVDGGTLVMTMELLTGESLGAKLERQECLSVAETADIGLPVASAVAAAHAQGIVHRDLKPENVFLHTSSDGSTVVKVLDFGIAKVTNVDLVTTYSAGLTSTGALLGTPAYMSPEQVFGEKDLDCRSDIWSLGVILYQCLSGVLPTKADNVGQVLKIVVAGRIFSLRDVAAEVPEDLAAMVDSMLARDRDRRPAHLGPVMDVLRRYSSVQVPPFAAPHDSQQPRSSSGGQRRGAVSSRGSDHAGASAGDTVRSGQASASEAARSAVAGGVPGSGGLPGAPSTGPAPAPLAHRRSPAKAAAWLGVGGVLLGLTAVATWRAGKATTAPAPSAVVQPSASSTPWGSAPLVASGNASASMAFRRAMLSYRDGSYADALAGMRSATQADPAMAAAWLRIAVWTFWSEPAACRQAFQEAVKFADRLTEQERGLSAALRPLVEASTHDLSLFAANLSALASRYPMDAELAVYAAMFNSAAGNQPKAIEFADRTLAIDPTFAQVRVVRGNAKFYSGGDWRSDFEACLHATPANSECLQLLATGELEAGDCAQAERHAKLLITLAPNDSRAYRLLAAAQVALGRPDESVRETLKRKLQAGHQQDARLLMSSTGAIDEYDEIALLVLAGSFPRAEAIARDLLKATNDAPDETTHAPPFLRMAELLVESGRLAEAAGIAGQFLRRREGWSQDSILDDWGIERDVVPSFQAILFRAGRIGREEWHSRRSAWAESVRARAAPYWQKWIWTHGFVGPAESRDEAIDALAALGEYSPQPEGRPGTLADADIGRVLVLADRPRDALGPLERATRACVALQFPFAHTRAHYYLGLAREKVGDLDGACAAYRVVLDRWRASGATSVTATRASERSLFLRCPPKP